MKQPLGKKTYEDIMGKGENSGNQHFLFFPLHFQIFSQANLKLSDTFQLFLSHIFHLPK